MQSLENEDTSKVATTPNRSDGSSHVSKKVKVEESTSLSEEAKRAAVKGSGKTMPLPSSVIVTFSNNDDARAGPPVDLPVDSNTKQIEALVNALLENAENLPYAFYINGVEVTDTLSETLRELQASGDNKISSFEDTLNVYYQPLSVYRVRPVTRCVETMPGHTDAVLHVSYSHDGRRLASGGGDMAVRFWNVISSTPAHTSQGHRHHVLCTAWSPDGALFVSADRSGDIRVWNPTDGSPLLREPLRGHRKWVTWLAFEPLHLVDIAPTDNRLNSRLASASKDGTVKVWNLGTGICETTISGHSDSIECVRWGGSGLIYTCSRDRTIKVWAIDGSGRSMQKLVRTLTGHAHRINTLALNCDYIQRTGGYELAQKDSAAASAASTSTTAELEAIKTKAMEKYNVLIGIDGERLVSGSDDFTLFMWQPQQDKHSLLRMTGHQQLVNHIAFSPDARYVASASFDKKVKIWCGRTGRFLATLTGHVGAVYQVAWSPDSQYIASASKDSTVKVWSMKDPKKAMHTLSGHADEVYTLDWSPNGSQLASGSKDRTIKIWHH